MRADRGVATNRGAGAFISQRNKAGVVVEAFCETGLCRSAHGGCCSGQDAAERQELAGSGGNHHAVVLATGIVGNLDRWLRHEIAGLRDIGVEFLFCPGFIAGGGFFARQRPRVGIGSLINRMLQLAFSHVPLRRVDRETPGADQRRRAKRHHQCRVATAVAAQLAAELGQCPNYLVFFGYTYSSEACLLWLGNANAASHGLPRLTGVCTCPA